MTYIRDFGKKLEKLLEDGDTEAVLKLAKDTVLESYNNGIEVGKSKKSKSEKE